MLGAARHKSRACFWRTDMNILTNLWIENAHHDRAERAERRNRNERRKFIALATVLALLWIRLWIY